MTRFRYERQRAVLADLIGCPGLYAGQYEDIELLEPEWVERRYEGGAGFMGLAKAYPTPEAHKAFEEQSHA